MHYRIYITPTALIDLDEAITYYNGKSDGLGYRFSDEVHENFAAIAQHPEAFAERYKNVRGKLVKKFPYLILYRVNHSVQSVEVIRIFNTWQNPYWA